MSRIPNIYFLKIELDELPRLAKQKQENDISRWQRSEVYIKHAEQQTSKMI